MKLQPIQYIGIELANGQHPYSYAALDNELRLVAVGGGSITEVLSYAAGQHSAQIAINAPSNLNMRIMEQPEFRQSLSPIPEPKQWMKLRHAEYELAQMGIEIPHTPSTISKCPSWVRRGFSLFRFLEELGYTAFPSENSSLQWVETPAEACYWALLGKKPHQEKTFEGRLQRQLLLWDLELPVPDPMKYFEEITRFRIINGELPENMIYGSSELNALAAAYTAWIAVNRPEQALRLGNPDEGYIFLPSRPKSK
jgi:hypothetical protein